MSKFTFTDSATGRSYAVTAPQGVSADQAQAMFRQQLDTGSLAGFDVGKTLSAATQAAGGLPSAQAMLNQTLAGASAQLPIGSAVNTISSALGPGGLAGAAQVAKSLQGGGVGIATNSVGSTANLSALAARTASSVGAPTGAITGLVTKAGAAITGTAAAAGSLASNTINRLRTSFAGAANNGINTADLIKQGKTGGLPDLTAVDTQAAMSQAAKLVGQPHTVATNAKGVGKFGFDLSQLTKAGFVKPGIAAAAGAGSALTSILKSPTAFTGKDGVKSLDGLLNNPTLQNTVQKNLMTTGLADLKAAGVPVPSLNPQATAGLANNAAKSVTNTIASLQNNVPADIKAKFDSVTKNSAYAVSLAQTKVDPAALGEVSAKPAVNTVNAETLNVAGKKILGNAKIPDVTGLPTNFA